LSVDPKQLRNMFGVPHYTIKCQPFKHLDPTDKLTIADWLIKFRAAAGASRRKVREKPFAVMLRSIAIG